MWRKELRDLYNRPRPRDRDKMTPGSFLASISDLSENIDHGGNMKGPRGGGYSIGGRDGGSPSYRGGASGGGHRTTEEADNRTKGIKQNIFW